ncbi:hypothetical protein HanIR_Chr16g0815971 [Helianthus annuus]|nr:hypothetical protein HanIR_Chr16g0815971 [Helianthus annuus]
MGQISRVLEIVVCIIVQMGVNMQVNINSQLLTFNNNLIEKPKASTINTLMKKVSDTGEQTNSFVF